MSDPDKDVPTTQETAEMVELGELVRAKDERKSNGEAPTRSQPKDVDRS